MFALIYKRNWITTSSITALMLFAGACSQPETFIKNKVDTFSVDTVDAYSQASSLLQADYVISVDFSYSMSGGCNGNTTYSCTSPKVTRLFDSLDSFVSDLKTAGIDYRIGFVRGSKQSTTNVADSDFISGLVITSAYSSSLTALIRSKLGPVGAPLEGNNTAVVEATSKVLTNRGSDFLRDSAQLVTVFVTDSDDDAYNSTQLSAIKATKTDASYVSARAALTGVNSQCYTDPDDYPEVYGEKYGTRVAAAVNYLDSSATTKVSCLMDNFSSIMRNVARTISRQTKRFKLQVPNPDTSTLKVYVGGTLKNKGTDSSDTTADYYYVAGTNEIVFFNGKEPAPSAQLRIEYDQIYVLSSTPNPETIEVQVNGAAVAQSATSGWSYEAGTNRITFNGSAKPANGAKIQIVYKLGV